MDAGTALHELRTSSHPGVALLRDVLWVVGVVGGIALALFLIAGTWPAVVTIESESMVPNMNVGDLVLVVQKDRYGEFQTWVEGSQSGYVSFGDYGDVIVYRPNGATHVHPIIHRAIVRVDADEVDPFFENPHAGYITKGDNNPVIDQGTYYGSVGVIEPVREEWIVGKALISVPLIGYLPLNIVPVAVFVIIVIIVHELFISRRQDEEKPEEGQRSRQRKK
ncbi:signal peptidase i [hydrocarbon metagenome]|uniref:Signal peptidase i n=1 Tax=hydrocarbon metagenome TaxID=938273 RepID=A0A0W8FIG2_9ZZZZ|nr:signal peptidase I [Methanomicrobiaceae archaeon]